MPERDVMLFLSYEPTGFTDGAGSQIQRIIGTYAISSLLGCKYYHSGLKKIDYQGFSALEKGEGIPDLVDWYNALVQLPVEPKDVVEFSSPIYMGKQPSLQEVLKLKEQSMLSKGDILLMMQLPYSIADQFPGCYSVVKGTIGPQALDRFRARFSVPFEVEFARNGDPSELVVAVHVRRGEILVNFPDRLLSNQYYVGVCKRIAELLDKIGRSYRFEVFTEVPSKPLMVTSKSFSFGRYTGEDTLVDPAAMMLSDFDEIPNVRYRVNEHQVSTLYNLANADILVGSRSSFSYVSGVAGNVKCSFFPKFWHSHFPDWIETNPDTGAFDLEVAENRLAASLR